MKKNKLLLIFVSVVVFLYALSAVAISIKNQKYVKNRRTVVSTQLQEKIKNQRKKIKEFKEEIEDTKKRTEFCHKEIDIFEEEKLKQQDSPKKAYIPTQDTLFPEKESPKKLKTCVILPAFIDFGGIESWMKNVQVLVDEMKEYSFYGVFVWDIETAEAIRFMKKKHVYIFEEIDALILNCHIVLNTAFHPLNHKDVVDVLVIHGAANDDWTFGYAKHYREYDEVIGVSVDSLDIVPKRFKKLALTIPSFVEKKENCSKEKHKYCKNQLLFVGRISSEKRPDLFCKAVCSLKDYCGVVVGPYYFKVNQFACDCPNIFYLGGKSDPQCYIRESKFLVVPSDSEGGPIVAIEAWINKVPVIMKKTGLAKQFEDSFLIYDWDNYSQESFQKLIESDPSEAVSNGLKTYKEKFSFEVISSQWKQILDEGKRILKERGYLLDYTLVRDKDLWVSGVKYHGKSLKINCMTDSCRFVIDLSKYSTHVCFDISILHSEETIKVSFGDTNIVLFNSPLRKTCIKSTVPSSKVSFKTGQVYLQVLNFQNIKEK